MICSKNVSPQLMMIMFNEFCVSCKLQHHQLISQSSWILSWNFSACTFGWRQKHSHRGSIQKLVKVASWKKGAHAKFSTWLFSLPWIHHFPCSFFCNSLMQMIFPATCYDVTLNVSWKRQVLLKMVTHCWFFLKRSTTLPIIKI